MTDILIPLSLGSRQGNLELRMCLRSIEKYLIGVKNIFIVGDKPDWVQGVVHIPCADNPNTWMRAHNIYRKIMSGIKYFDLNFYLDYDDFIKNEFTASGLTLSDNFLFMNDDHFLLSDYVAGEFPYYHRGQIMLSDFSNNLPQYKQYQNTIRIEFGSDYYDFDVHCPVVYNKETFKEIFSGLPAKWPEYGFAIKSFYCNRGHDTTSWAPCEDLKFTQPAMKETIYQVLEGRNWFSIGDRSLRSGGMKDVLQELYPTKSKYEI